MSDRDILSGNLDWFNNFGLEEVEYVVGDISQHIPTPLYFFGQSSE
jgi:hypothetical protein